MEHICGNVYMDVILYKIMICELFFKLKKVRKNVILDIFTISPLQRPREISQNVSGLYYVRRGAGYKIPICAKLYYLGRAKVFSSVATDFGSWTIYQVCSNEGPRIQDSPVPGGPRFKP